MSNTEADGLSPLLEEIDDQGAEQPQRLIERLGQARYDWLIEKKYLKTIPVQKVGELCILGPEGRAALGKSRTGKTVPESALGQFYRRRLRESLEAHGWDFEHYARPDYKPDPMPVFAHKDKKRLYTLCKGSEYSTQTLKRVLKTFRSELYDHGQLLVVTEEPHRFRYLLKYPQWKDVLTLTTLQLT